MAGVHLTVVRKPSSRRSANDSVAAAVQPVAPGRLWLDEQGVIDEADPQAGALLACAPALLQGRSLTEFIPELTVDGTPASFCISARLIYTARLAKVFVIRRADDGEFAACLTIARVGHESAPRNSLTILPSRGAEVSVNRL